MSAEAASHVNAVDELPERDPRPVVALPRQGLPGAAIAAMAIVLALILFLVLDAQRRRAASATTAAQRPQPDAFAPPPPLFVPPEPSPVPPSPATVTVVTTRPPAAIASPRVVQPQPSPPPAIAPVFPSPPPIIAAQPAERPTPRLNEPALIFDGGSDQIGETTTARAQAQGGTGDTRRNGAGLAGNDAPARATLIANRTTVMPVGTIIPAVLETPIDTARPGLLRAIVSEDARGFDGRRVLVPRGSRLIGEYQSEVRANQHRVLVTWTRLIRPDGAAIRLESPAADTLGGAGVPGHLHTYFLQRFAGALLQSALQVGVNLASRPGNGSVIVGLPGTTVNNVVGQGLQSSNNYQPKITVKQGAAINVFVARDLDFSGVPSPPELAR